MRDFKLSPKALVMVQGSSKGTQPKYYEDGYWYKVNNVGYEGIAEELTTKLLSCTNVTDFVAYEQCMVNGRPGCRSKNFLEQGESFISFQRLYDLYCGGNLQNEVMRLQSVEDRINFVKDFVYKHTGYDCSGYLSQILSLDMITLNTDRHFNNLGLIANPEAEGQKYYAAPVFDNGNSLLSDWERFSEDSLEENIDKVYGQPFSANLATQARAAGFGLVIDYQKLDMILKKEPQSRALEVLRSQIVRYRHIFPELDDRAKDAVRIANAIMAQSDLFSHYRLEKNEADLEIVLGVVNGYEHTEEFHISMNSCAVWAMRDGQEIEGGPELEREKEELEEIVESLILPQEKSIDTILREAAESAPCIQEKDRETEQDKKPGRNGHEIDR